MPPQFNFADFFQQYAGIGLQNGLGVDMFANSFPGTQYLATNPDADLQRVSEAGFDFNRFLGQSSVTNTQNQLDNATGFRDYYNENNADLAGTKLEGFGNSIFDQIENDYGGDVNAFFANVEADTGGEIPDFFRNSFNNFQSDINSQGAEQSQILQDYAPITGALAGLQELQGMVGEEQGRARKLAFQDPARYRVNPTNGAQNFLNKEGGAPHKKQDKMKKLPKNFKTPRMSFAKNTLAGSEGVQHFKFGGGVGINDETGNFEEQPFLKDRYVFGTNRMPIQTESGGKGKEEMIILPTLDLINVNADKRHSKMDREQVTDYVPEGSYILSQFGEVNINREEAENLTTELGVLPYSIFDDNPIPQKKSLADVMKKKNMTPADVGRAIKKKFKTIDSEDVFFKNTNEKNRINSLPYLQSLMVLSETDKARKGLESEITSALNDGGSLPRLGGADAFANGGIVKRKNVPRAVLPALVAAAPLLGSVIGGFFNNQALNKSNALLSSATGLAKAGNIEQAEQARGKNALAGLTQIAANAAVDTTEDIGTFNNNFLNQTETQLKNPIIEQMVNRTLRNLPTGNVLNNAPTFALGANALAQQFGQASDQAVNLEFQNQQLGLQNRNALLGQLQTRTDVRNAQIAGKSNIERSRNNTLIQSTGNIVASGLGNDASIESGRIQENNRLGLQLAGHQAGIAQAKGANIVNSIAGGVQGLNSLAASGIFDKAGGAGGAGTGGGGFTAPGQNANTIQPGTPNRFSQNPGQSVVRNTQIGLPQSFTPPQFIDRQIPQLPQINNFGPTQASSIGSPQIQLSQEQIVKLLQQAGIF